jgi:hypothetical protein
MYQSESHTVGVEGDLVQLGISRHCGQGLLRRIDECDLHGVPKKNSLAMLFAFLEVVT